MSNRVEKRTLILKSDRTNFERFYIDNMQRENVVTLPIYSFRGGLLWYVTVMWIEKLNLPFKEIFYNKLWKYDLKDYDMVVIFDRNLSWDIIGYIKKKNPKIRCIAWYWNTILDSQKMDVPSKYKNMCEKWSFDQLDCDNYECKKNIQFYFEGLDKVGFKEKEYDAFFVGTDKGRYKIICDVISALEKYGYTTFKGVIKDKTSDVTNDYIEPMNYKDVIALIQKSECIIDIPQDNQDGITLRVLEALFFGRKLITTNPNIRNFDFYNSNNILVWNNPTREEIDTFFNSELVTIDKRIVRRYSFESWIKNFDVKDY